jgi:hypothetical protein
MLFTHPLPIKNDAPRLGSIVFYGFMAHSASGNRTAISGLTG